MRLFLLLAYFSPSIALAQLEPRMLADTGADPTDSPLIAGPMVEMDGHLYFAGYRQFYARVGFELWRTDGTTAELVRHFEDPYHFIAMYPKAPRLRVAGSHLMVSVHNEGLIDTAFPVWASDGSAAGTNRLTLVQDIFRRELMDAAGDPILFANNDYISGDELWVSDGTDSGTHLLVDLEPGEAGSSPNSFIQTAHGVRLAVRRLLADRRYRRRAEELRDWAAANDGAATAADAVEELAQKASSSAPKFI